MLRCIPLLHGTELCAEEVLAGRLGEVRLQPRQVLRLYPGQEGVLGLLQHKEAQSKKGGAQQVSDCGEEGNGGVVRVGAAVPHAVDHHLAEVEQQPHLQDHSDRARGEVSVL